MFLYEYEGKFLFQRLGIPTPPGKVANNLEEAVKIADEIGYPVVLKPQIIGGRRGRAGAIRFAENQQELRTNFEELSNLIIHGKKVEKILIEKKINIKHEYYVSFLLDFSHAKPVLIFSSEGGIEIEEIAAKYPQKLVTLYLNPEGDLQPYTIYSSLNRVGIFGDNAKKFIPIIMKLWELFSEYELILAEINPLAETPEGELVALDARIIADDNAEFRQSYIKEFKASRGGLESVEYKAKEKGLSFVVIDEEGDIGIIGNGAGLTLATVDIVRLLGGKPANFLDVGGGASAERIRNAVQTLLLMKNLKKIFVNIFGGITRCDEVAKGLVRALEELNLKVPMIVRLTGTLEDEGRRILREVGIEAYNQMLEAARKVVMG
ncbi:MAG: ADP-forming succinate--CoA ligase subunit beta [Crenarchaeota archaeon]|nr:ADP-forming succinate--CoA ligase subunit beta [Thermoproteota archaeon]MCR8453875.1 ADP-forming succinate--CoA ligase subunit beta [Thermoproteota archaeon]MCR8455306.1 ADP-forming succinate--CoA ligase subunit beta [Thermoproteota archaeon]MCR8462576.1 ADP-forming succinate--CoA ligase subunit beta [Thermoproteota archaeon]MCR8470696.1 ADP-forming succinate--CoA ligase subunit beta [Thermoproteota archaeon]